MRQTFAYSLIFSLLISLSGFQISFHSCGGELRSIGLFSKATACEHAQEEKEKEGPCCGETDLHCKRKQTTSEQKPKGKCCDDTLIAFEILKLDLQKLEPADSKLLIDIAKVPYTFGSVIHSRPSLYTLAYPIFKPPLQQLNLSILLQVFLI